MASETFTIDIVARLDQLKSELAKIPDIGGKSAKELTTALSKEIKAAEKAAKAAAKAAADTKQQFQTLGNTSGKVGSAAAKLAGALDLIAPGAGEAARAVNDLADVGEVAGETGSALGVTGATLGASMTALAAAVGGAYLAWRIYSEDATRAAETAALVTAAHVAQQPILEHTRAALLDLAEATGELSAEQADLARNSARALEAYQKATADARAKLSELKAEQSGVLTQLVDAAEDVVPAWTPLGLVIDGLTTSTAEYQGQIDALQGSIDAGIEATREDVKVTGETIKAKGRAASASVARAEATEQEREAQAALNAVLETAAELEEVNAKVYADAAEAIRSAGDDARDSQLDAISAVIDARDEEIAKLREQLADGLLAKSENLAAQQELQAAFDETRIAMLTEAEAEIAAIRAKAAADAQASAEKAAETVRETYEATMAAAADLASATSDGLGFIAEEIAGKSKAGAMAFFVAMKAAAIAAAGINTALGVTQALTLPPPADAIKAAAVVAAGAVQVAEIAAQKPSFHAGGIMYPDERNATVLPGESVLNRAATAAIGPQGIGAMNAGAAPMATAVLRIGRKEAREIARTDVRANGLIPATARKEAAKGARGAGVTGRRPIA
jgi:hypothetical protein